MLVLEYDAFALPTAQHRAGLAGLIVLVETMRGRGMVNTPVVLAHDGGRVRVEWTEAALQAC